jgi:hypothetical protein
MMIDMKGLKNALKSKSVDDIKSFKAEVCKTEPVSFMTVLVH